MAQRSDAGLSGWLDEVEISEIEPLKSFGRGVKRDEAAVRAGLKLRWNQGPVEGSVNKLKLVKRAMFGRASFELLRKEYYWLKLAGLNANHGSSSEPRIVQNCSNP